MWQLDPSTRRPSATRCTDASLLPTEPRERAPAWASTASWEMLNVRCPARSTAGLQEEAVLLHSPQQCDSASPSLLLSPSMLPFLSIPRPVEILVLFYELPFSRIYCDILPAAAKNDLKGHFPCFLLWSKIEWKMCLQVVGKRSCACLVYLLESKNDEKCTLFFVCVNVLMCLCVCANLYLSV